MVSRATKLKRGEAIPQDPFINKAGYIITSKINDTMQGSIYRAIKQSTKQSVVIKKTSLELHSKSIVIVDGIKYRVNENILKETAILKYFHDDKNCPKSIVQYIDSFKSSKHYYLVMEDGGHCLFDFCIKVHRLIQMGSLEIVEWHRIIKIIFKQLMEGIEYIHSKNVSHFDISCENILINDLDVVLVTKSDGKQTIKFTGDIQIKICDMGLAELFPNNKNKLKSRNGDNKTYNNHWDTNKYCGKSNYQSPEVSIKKQYFNAKSNDIFCFGVCFFMLCIGSSPWNKSKESDAAFYHIWNGNLLYVLSSWNKLHLVNKEIIELFQSFFKNENERITMEQLKNCKWLN